MNLFNLALSTAYRISTQVIALKSGFQRYASGYFVDNIIRVSET